MDGDGPALGADLALDLRLDAATVASGQTLSGRLLIRNGSDQPLLVDADVPVFASLLEAGTDVVAGGMGGWVGGSSIALEIAPGDVAEVGVLVGTTVGRANVAPGSYEAVASLPLLVGPRRDVGQRIVVTSPRRPITVT